MEYAITILSLILYIIIFIRLKNNSTYLQLSNSIIFIIGLTIIGELDILLPLYFLASLFPYIQIPKKIHITAILIILYYATYLAIGLFAQDVSGTLITFISKIWQFIVFFIVLYSENKLDQKPTTNILKIIAIVETILGLYLLVNSNLRDANGLTRLVSNAQPITGNLTIIAIPISIYLYFNGSKKIKKEVLLINLYLALWIILSGTRGYTLIYLLSILPLLFNYFVKTHNNSKISIKAIIPILAMTILATLFLISPMITEKVFSVLRVNSSVGIRTYENAAEINFFKETSTRTRLLGIGIGGNAGSYTEFRTSILEQVYKGMWNKNNYLDKSGALFHNLFANILLTQGIIGIIVNLIINILIWNKIKNEVENKQIKMALHLYQIGFIIMNYYRWSAICGIAEMIILATVVKLSKKNKQEK